MEGLKERYCFYEKYIKYIRIKSFHAQTGFFFNENIKIFSILAKRKKIKIVGHEQGVNNFVFIGKSKIISDYKGFNQFFFTDFFLTWNKVRIADKYKYVDQYFDTKVTSIGSVYLHELKKDKKEVNTQNNFVMFYCPSQLRKFITYLGEMTPEKNYQHKKNVAFFLKKILSLNSNIEIIYKPFHENAENIDYDPMYEFLSAEMNQNKVIVTNEIATNIMKTVDLILFDFISTGFAEAINIGKPSIICSTKFEYNLASSEGKKINQQLYKEGIIFYNEKEGLKILKKILDNKIKFQNDTQHSINIFKEAMAHPISKHEFFRKMQLMNL